MTSPLPWLFRGWKPRSVVLAAGPLADPAWLAKEVDLSDAFVVCADAGLSHLPSLGLTPSLWIGDADSEPSGPPPGIESKLFSAEKNETDLELALRELGDRKLAPVAVLGALGGRLDQELANFHLAAGFRARSGRIAFYGEGCRIRIACPPDSELLVAEPFYDYVSLVPLGGDAEQVESKGLRWDLAGETLEWTRARGVSNYLTGQRATVRVGRGSLAIVEQHASSEGLWPAGASVERAA